VPEQREAEQATLHSRSESEYRHLHHHHEQPDQSERNVQPVASDKREECGTRKALRCGVAPMAICLRLPDLET
jgi:hypothetical protein